MAEKMDFLWLVLPKKEWYVGEVVLAEMRLYLRSEVHDFDQVQIPPLRGDGFTSSKFVQGNQFERRVGTAQFKVIPIMATMTPVKSGELTIGPLNGSLVVRLLTGRSG